MADDFGDYPPELNSIVSKLMDAQLAAEQIRFILANPGAPRPVIFRSPLGYWDVPKLTAALDMYQNAAQYYNQELAQKLQEHSRRTAKRETEREWDRERKLWARDQSPPLPKRRRKGFPWQDGYVKGDDDDLDGGKRIRRGGKRPRHHVNESGKKRRRGPDAQVDIDDVFNNFDNAQVVQAPMPLVFQPLQWQADLQGPRYAPPPVYILDPRTEAVTPPATP
jgi:hypothetical protein